MASNADFQRFMQQRGLLTENFIKYVLFYFSVCYDELLTLNKK
jgi:hypothetical protein